MKRDGMALTVGLSLLGSVLVSETNDNWNNGCIGLARCAVG